MVGRLFPALVAAVFATGLSADRAGAPAISFFKEEITFTICAADTIEVRGCYWFRNSTSDSVSTVIFYPFPVHQHARFPHHIAVQNGALTRVLPFRTQPDGIEWLLRLPANAVDSTWVIYRQKVARGMGEYIVSTTKQWGMPLQEADFVLRVPERFTLSFWSFMADSMSVKHHSATYYAHCTGFFPESEMIVRWK